MTTIILPKRNKKDLEDVPKNVRSDMKFVFAESMDDVLPVALEGGFLERKRPSAKSKKSSSTSSGKTRG